MTHFNLVSDNDGLSLIVTYNDGETTTFPESHPRFADIKEHVLASLGDGELDEDYIKEKGDLALQVGQHLNYVSPRVRVSNGALYFDGDLIDNSLTEHVLRLLETNDDGWRAFVNFMEKVYTNPSVASRDSLYTWLSGKFQTGRLTITQDGDFIAYKGTARRADGTPVSVHSGRALVNGQVVEGQIPNVIGSVIEMPRSDVDDNTQNNCSTGLHAGTWEYAEWFSRDLILTVKINPRDVVSVPNDSNSQKLRVSRYEVIASVDKPYTQPTYTVDEYDEDYEDYEYCDDCDISDADADLYTENGLTLCDDCAEERRLEWEEEQDVDDEER